MCLTSSDTATWSACRTRPIGAKLVLTTSRGDELYAIAREFVAELEIEWGRRLGTRRLRQLRELLTELNEVL